MNKRGEKILIVDDDKNILYAFKQVLKKDGYRCIVARDGEEALEKMSKDKPAAVFMDITMPKLNGLETLKMIKDRNQTVPIIIITGHGTMQTAIRAMQLGAFEYLTKPLDVKKIREVAQRAISSISVPAPQGESDGSLNDEDIARHRIVGSSKRMQELYKLIGSISTTTNHTSVLIIGESGTGKELVARAIHTNSAQSADPFVAINCTVLPEALLESELFGHERGAFTGANERKLGKFEMAAAGTIFLDEIGNLSPHLQQKLLRVIQEREFERLGGNTIVHVYARFIAATNRNIENEVKQGNFREDLYYRLNVVTIQLPPLRERLDDVPSIAQYFLAKYNTLLQKSVRAFAEDARALLQTYSYPGNVRELENLVERAVMLTNGDLIPATTIQEMIHTTTGKESMLPIISPAFSKSRKHLLAMFERQFLLEQLKKHRGNVTAAAKASKMTRQNFQRLMTKYRTNAKLFRG